MELINQLQGKRVYIDTNIFVYMLNGDTRYQTLMNALVASLDLKEFKAYTSYITMSEVLPIMAQDGDKSVVTSAIQFLRDDSLFSLCPADNEICSQAGLLACQYGLKSSDAIHVSTAIFNGCDVFLTNNPCVEMSEIFEHVLLSSYAQTEPKQLSVYSSSDNGVRSAYLLN